MIREVHDGILQLWHDKDRLSGIENKTAIPWRKHEAETTLLADPRIGLLSQRLCVSFSLRLSLPIASIQFSNSVKMFYHDESVFFSWAICLEMDTNSPPSSHISPSDSKIPS